MEAQINPSWVRYQMCLASINEIRDVEDIEEKVVATLAGISAFYDGVSELMLDAFLAFVDIHPKLDPVIESICRDKINVFHVSDLLRVYEPLTVNWIDPENQEAFWAMVDDDFAEFLSNTRRESRSFRPRIEQTILEYISKHQ